MSFKKTLSKTTLPFAHLLGISARAEEDDDKDDDKKQRPDESDEDYAKRMEEDESEEKKTKGIDDDQENDSDAEDDDDSADAEESDDEDEKDKEEDKEKTARKGRAASARKRERMRCAKIFGSKAAGDRPDVAAHLAFNTSMSAKSAIAMLHTVSASGALPKKTFGLSQRMSLVNLPNVGTDSTSHAQGSVKTVAQQIIDAGKKRRGEI